MFAALLRGRAAVRHLLSGICAALLPFLTPGTGLSQEPVDFETARFDRRLPAVRAAQPVRIDGILDEDEWAGAPLATDFIQGNPNEGMPATFVTEVRVLYDDDFLYVGARRPRRTGRIDRERPLAGLLDPRR